MEVLELNEGRVIRVRQDAIATSRLRLLNELLQTKESLVHATDIDNLNGQIAIARNPVMTFWSCRIESSPLP